MNVLFAREFTRRYQDAGIIANSLHPGVIGTELARDQGTFGKMLGIFALPLMKSIPQGAATTVYVATSPDYQDTGGLYFSNSAEAKTSHKHAADDELARMVWELSEELAGLK